MSTTTTLIQLTDGIYRATEEKKISSIMALDQSSAFDCVRHSLLIDKLRLYNVDETVLTWIRSYLTDRRMYVNIGRAETERRDVSRGVPQGSVLGPLLYSVYTNEITEAVREDDCSNQVHADKETLLEWTVKNVDR